MGSRLVHQNLSQLDFRRGDAFKVLSIGSNERVRVLLCIRLIWVAWVDEVAEELQSLIVHLQLHSAVSPFLVAVTLLL